MQLSYKRTHKESYMIIESAVEASEFEKRMLKENEIRCLLSFYTMQIDEKIQYWHDISGKQSLQEYLEQERISLQTLEHVFAYLLQAFEELNHYLIKQSHILMLPETIYVERQKKFELYLCFCPEASDEKSGLTPLMEYVVQKVEPSEEELVALCFELYEMTLRDGGNLQKLHEMVLAEMQKEIEVPEVPVLSQAETINQYEVSSPQEPQQQSYPYPSTYDTPVEEDDEDYEEDEEEYEEEEGFLQKVVSLIQTLIEQLLQKREKKESSGSPKKQEDFYVEPVPEVVAPTELLYQGAHGCQGNLLYQGMGEEKNFIINKDVYAIGHKAGNDACLSSTGVSRRHAKIYKEGSTYYIEDLNSTNGTLLNGELLNCMQRYELSYMDRLQFADVPYLFV